MAIKESGNEFDLETFAQDKFERGHRLNNLRGLRRRLLANGALSDEDNAAIDAARERYEADPFAELFGSIKTYFRLLEQGRITLVEARARITEAAEIHKKLAEIKGIPAKPL